MAKEKQPLTAVQRGKRGALIGMILVEIIMVLMIFVESSNIIEVIGGILIAGLAVLFMALAMLLVCAGCWAGRPVHCIIADMYWMQAFSGGFAPEEKKVLSEG